MPIILEFNTMTKDNTHTHFPYKSFIYIFYVIISTACERYQRKYRYLHTRLLRNEDDNDETSCVFEKSLLLFFWSVEAADICTAGVCSVLLLLFYTLKGRRFFFFLFHAGMFPTLPAKFQWLMIPRCDSGSVSSHHFPSSVPLLLLLLTGTDEWSDASWLDSNRIRK